VRLARVSNFLARSIIVFIVAYLWLSFYLKEIVAVFLISFCIMFLVNCFFYFLTRRRTALAALNRKEQEHLRQVTLQLKFQSRMSTLDLLKTAFEKLEKNVKTTQKKVIIKKEDSKINIFPLFNTTPTVDDVIACVKATTRDTQTVIFADSFSPEVSAFAKTLDLPITMLSSAEVYKQVLLPADVFPEILVKTKSKARLTLAALKQMAFHRSKFRSYVFIALVIFATSFIVRFSIYYLIISTVLFSFALISLFALPSKSEIL